MSRQGLYKALSAGGNPSFATIVKVAAVSSGWAEGRASLGSFTVNLANPTAIGGAAQLSGISLAALYAPNGWIGALLAPLGIKIAFSELR